MPTLISTSMMPSITNGDLRLLAQKQTIANVISAQNMIFWNDKKRGHKFAFLLLAAEHDHVGALGSSVTVDQKRSWAEN